MTRKTLVVLTISVLISLLMVVLPASAQEPPPDLTVPGPTGEDVYVVQLSLEPVAAYDGSIDGFPATSPAPGEHLNPNSNAVQRYVNHLSEQQEAVLQAAGIDPNTIIYRYFYSFNGFTARLSPSQVQALEKSGAVVNIWEDIARFPDTENSPDFLGLTAEGGLWDELGGQGAAGEDVIIGVLDTGIWPEHPSFSDQVGNAEAPGNSGKKNLAYGPPPAHWNGECVSGEQFSQNDCNNKLIGARFYRLGAAASTVIPEDYLSPRDRDGHGTHTASTAGGNAGVQSEIFGIDRGVVSGIAPRARIAAYKVCWNDAGCFTSDIVAAIDDSVVDGVDVINYSIGGGASLLGPDDVAYLFAADANVWVATSAGNAGPGAATVGGPASVPWITAIGASTQDRTFQGSVALGDGSEYFGASITSGTDVLPLVDSADAGSELCLVGELDPAVVEGNIVLCKRGVTPRVDKSLAVYEAGGAGMVLYNENDNQSQVTDNHWVPSVHINYTDGVAVKAYIAGAGGSATAQIIGGVFTPIDAPWMADFSSRGPNPVAPDIIKPDITAPGVNVLAGNSPNPFLGAPGQLFQSISGTSMASPHIAGIFALLRQAHPTWSAAAAKSAIMTTAHQDVMKEDGSTPADPFDMGGGHVEPNSAVDPGLVYEAGFLEYLAFLCGSTSGVGQGTCDFLASNGYSFDASDLNLASIGIAELAGNQTITRTVTNVGPAGTYNVSVEAPAGIDVVVSPASLTLGEGESASYEVTFTTLESAATDEWTFGSLTWSHGPHNVRSPIAIKPVAFAAPDEVTGSGVEGSLSYDITFGYTGDFAAEPHGLFAPDTINDTVVDDPANDIGTALATDVGINYHFIDIPAGTEYARFSLFDDYTDGQDDLDLYVFGPATAGYPQVGSSGTSTSAEEVNLVAPAEGTYIVAVHGWQTDGPDANYTLFSWLLNAADEGNMIVTAPASATLGATGSITVDWSDLETGMKYLGSVAYYRSGALADFTIVNIETD